MNTGYFSIRAINSLLLALLINKIISGDCIFTERGGKPDLLWINEPLEVLEERLQVLLTQET